MSYSSTWSIRLALGGTIIGLLPIPFLGWVTAGPMDSRFEAEFVAAFGSLASLCYQLALFLVCILVSLKEPRGEKLKSVVGSFGFCCAGIACALFLWMMGLGILKVRSDFYGWRLQPSFEKGTGKIKEFHELKDGKVLIFGTGLKRLNRDLSLDSSYVGHTSFRDLLLGWTVDQSGGVYLWDDKKRIRYIEANGTESTVFQRYTPANCTIQKLIEGGSYLSQIEDLWLLMHCEGSAEDEMDVARVEARGNVARGFPVRIKIPKDYEKSLFPRRGGGAVVITKDGSYSFTNDGVVNPRALEREAARPDGRSQFRLGNYGELLQERK